MEQKDLGRADLHIHTTYSYDGVSSPESVVAKASEIGLDIIAITDHDEIQGGLEAQKYESKYGIDVIAGEEILTNEGEVIALFITKKIAAGMPLYDTVCKIREQGGLVVIPHPFSLFPLTRPAVGVKNLYSLFKEKKFVPDAIEIMNSTPAGRISYKKNKRINDSVFLLSEVGGSDAHIKEHIGMGLTLFPGTTKEDLRAAILSKKTTTAGEFTTRKESVQFVKQNIMKRARSTKDKMLSRPYNKIKNTIHKYFP